MLSIGMLQFKMLVVYALYIFFQFGFSIMLTQILFCPLIVHIYDMHLYTFERIFLQKISFFAMKRKYEISNQI